MSSAFFFKLVSGVTCGEGALCGKQSRVNMSQVEFLDGSNNLLQQ